MKMVLVPKLDNSKVLQMDLKEKFAANKREKIKLFD
jgi:hypothetical protein